MQVAGGAEGGDVGGEASEDVGDLVEVVAVAAFHLFESAGEHGRDAAVMVAVRTADVDDLNGRARDRMAATGQLTGPTLEATDRCFRARPRPVRVTNVERRPAIANVAWYDRVAARAGAC